MLFKILMFKCQHIKKLFNDKEGFIFSTDLMLSLIVLTMIIGISANALDYSNEFMGDQNSRAVMERSTLEAANILIKTPGSPHNWETLSNFNGVSPGLALYNNSSIENNDKNSNDNLLPLLSWEKINQLSKNYDEIMKNQVFPPNVKTSMVLYPLNPNINPVVINNDTEHIKSPEIVVINRTVQCNFLSNFTLVSMEWNKNKLNNSENVSNTFSYSIPDICPHEGLNNNLNHTSPTESSPSKIWVCEHFNTSPEELKNKDYYLITDPSPILGESVHWVLDTADNVSDKKNSFGSSNIELNHEIKHLMGEKKNETIWIHVIGPEIVNKPFKIFVVAIPKNTNIQYKKAEYFHVQTCNFVLKSWIDD